MDNICVICKRAPVVIKKRQLCPACYQRERKKAGNFFTDFDAITPERAKSSYKREIEFIKNFFKHNNWTYHPAHFYMNGTNYTPDFYDQERGTFIEVSGTRQAYHSNKEKYDLFRETYPDIKFEIRKPSGDLLEEEGRIDW